MRVSVIMVAMCAAAGGSIASAASWAHARAHRFDDGAAVGEPAWPVGPWMKLATEPYPGKQDDIVFVSDEVGFYGNGKGLIYKTVDGGETWAKVFEKSGTFVRCLGFVDEKLGFAGNIGPGYFPGVTDETILYRTRDGGETWEAVENLDVPGLVRLCAIEVSRFPFINAGVMDHKTLIAAGGRVGGPAFLVLSDDLGETWRGIDLRPHGAMVLDVHFFTDKIGLVATSTSTDVQESRARIIRTEDGGATWTTVYESTRPFELTWKMSFPTRDVGYCTIQSYNPDPAASQRFVAKTTDGGRTWAELPLTDNHGVREFGIGFIDADVGFVGAAPHGFATTDGGATWERVDFGNAVNKIRILRHDDDGDGKVDRVRAFGIGVHVFRLDAKPAAAGGDTAVP